MPHEVNATLDMRPHWAATDCTVNLKVDVIYPYLWDARVWIAGLFIRLGVFILGLREATLELQWPTLEKQHGLD